MSEATTIWDDIVGAGGSRDVVARWVITGSIVLKSPAHFGGVADFSFVDSVILRDSVTGKPLLPGSSIAGALRSYLTDYLGGYFSNEDDRVALLFGGRKNDDNGAQSPLIIFDSIGDTGKHAIEIRDGVAIDPDTGVASKHKKFDREILPAGTRFPLRLELLIPKGCDEAEILSFLLTVLRGLQRGEIHLGAHKTRGLGKCTVENWRAKRFDLSKRSGWLEWLTTDHEKPLKGVDRLDDIVEAIEKEFQPPLELPSDNRNLVKFTLDLKLSGGILIRSPGRTAKDPDSVHLTSGGESIISGTSMAGVLRSQVLKIAKTVHSEDADLWVDCLFGAKHEDTDDTTEDKKTWASRVLVSESKIHNGTRLQPSRIRIDRFTGGVIDGALFTEEPHYLGNTRVTVELKDPQPGEVGLMLLALRDLITGTVPIGGSSSVGRGFVTGSITVTGLKINGTTLEQVKIQPGVECKYSDELNGLVKAFIDCKPAGRCSEEGE